MARHHTRRLGVLGGLGVGLAGFGLMVSAGVSVDSSDLPDLEPLLPKNHSNPNDRWVDTVYTPGRALFRFDTVILNTGAGAFEVIRDDSSSPTEQYVWENKVPPAPVTVDTPPPETGASGERRLVASANSPNAIAYSSVIGHNHFHTQLIAAYELRTEAGALVTRASKNTAGFCLYDSWGDVAYYDASLCRPTQSGWNGAIRMGISPGRGDFYGSQLGDQWIDVTDVTPGTYALRAEVNPAPARIYDESDTTNNVITENGVVIPGAIAAAASAATPAGAAVDIPLSGTLVGASVGSRKPTCTEDQTSEPTCLQTATAGRLTFQASGAPSAGTVQITDAAPDLAAVARFTPPAGFTGTATFRYTTRDTRGLTSAPATVTVTVGSSTTTPPPPGGGAGGPGPGGTAKTTVTLKPAFALVRRGGKTFLKVGGTLPRSQAGRLVRVQRKAGKRITTIGTARVAKTGRYTRLIRVRTPVLSVRAALGSSATTRAATSPFRRIS